MKFYKILLIILVFSAFFGGWWLVGVKSTPPNEENTRVFASEIYRHYNQQLKNVLQKHPYYQKIKQGNHSKMQQLIACIENPLGNPQDQKATHQQFVKHLRAAIEENPPHEQDAQALLDALVRWIYLEADLREDLKQFTYTYVNPSQDDVIEMQKQLHEDNRFAGMENRPHHEDSFLYGNLPTLYASTPTTVVRMGKPLITSPKSFGSVPKVCPAFLRFIQTQPSHLYVNLLKRRGVEKGASKALEELEKHNTNFYIVTLDKDSSFYKQSDAYSTPVMEEKQFKHQFLNELLSPKGNYFWSKHLSTSNWKTELKDILNKVHSRYFSNRPTLTQEERKDFIELTYVAILDALVNKWQPASMNITCNQGMDRGPSLMVLWLQMHNPWSHQETAALLLAPPLLTHNRSSHASRIERFASASRRLNAHD